MLFKLKYAAPATAALALVMAVPASSHNHGHGQGDGGQGQGGQIAHVLLISVDGLHQSDLQWYVTNHRGSELAKLTSGGAEYSNARTPIPSDSFPGMVGQVTGGNPRTTGVYYDAEYSHKLLPAGTTTCNGQTTGAEVNYFENLAKNPSSIDSGQGITGLPDNILQLTPTPQNTLIDTTKLPVDPHTCTPVYPHRYIKVNTVFEVARQHALRTAWSDKHVAYDILNGPSGNGIQDLFTPEINSDAFHSNGTPYGGDWTKHNSATMQYDSYKVRAILNEIDGFDHSRSQLVGTPAVFGMNFQTISTAEKLPASDGQNGGYLPGTSTPGPLLSTALDYINNKIAAMDGELQAQGLSNSTAIVISAKHGQSPIDPLTLTRIADGPIITDINNAWKAKHPSQGNLVAADDQSDPANAAGSRDDAFPLWLNYHSRDALNTVYDVLWNQSRTGTTYNTGDPIQAGPKNRTLDHSGLKALYLGDAAARYFRTSPSDPRHPDVWGVVQHGVVYTGGLGKIAEHGGADFEDRGVPILVYAPSAVQPGSFGQRVETTQIAPTILSLLGLRPSALQAVRIEGTPVLPGIGGESRQG